MKIPEDWPTEEMQEIGNRIAATYGVTCAVPVFKAMLRAAPTPPACQMCNGHGLIGGFVSSEQGYYSETCPDCNTPPATVSSRAANRVIELLDELSHESRADLIDYIRTMPATPPAQSRESLVYDLTAPVPFKTPPAQEDEPLTRFCPSCGLVGEVGKQYRDCCPDGSDARIIPARLAAKCHLLFKGTLETACASQDNDKLRQAAEEALDLLESSVFLPSSKEIVKRLRDELDKAK